MKQIAIIVLSHNWNPYYSVASVVKTQIRSLVRAGYRPRVLLIKTHPPGILRHRVDYRMCLPHTWYDDIAGRPNSRFYGDVDNIEKVLEENLKGIDIVFTHDLLYLRLLLPYNLAIRRIAKKQKTIQWLHWSHSSPIPPPNFKLKFPDNSVFRDMPRSTFISVTKPQAKGYARMYGVPRSRVAVVYNPRATQDFLCFRPVIERMVEKYRILSADIVSVVPMSFGRIYKQPEICLYLIAALKEAGQKVRLIFANPYARTKTDDESMRIMQLKWLARKLGLNEEEVIITSDTYQDLKHGCSERDIKDLFSISNVYILSSVYETSSLVLMEAALTKNLCVINRKLKSLHGMVRQDALWFDFDTLPEVIKKKYKAGDNDDFYRYYFIHYTDNKTFYKMCARKIIRSLEKNPALSLFTRVKQDFNEQAVFEKQLKPLLER